jgi:4-carboxymuconolactone decarboxylase
MSRIPLMTPEKTRNAAPEFVDRRGGLAVYRLLANAPQVFAGWTQMVDEALDSPTFSARMRELVILRVAFLQGSSYQLGQHLDVGRGAGISAQQLEAVSTVSNWPCWNSSPSCAPPTTCATTPSPAPASRWAMRRSPSC